LSYYLKFKGKPDITNNFIIKKYSKWWYTPSSRSRYSPSDNSYSTWSFITSFDTYDKSVLPKNHVWGYVSITCFAFLRIGEITSRSKTYQNLLLFQDVKLQLIWRCHNLSITLLNNRPYWKLRV
jgi:hypothetical protein